MLKDVKNYGALKSRYCEDEGKAYEQGSAERQRRTEAAIRTSLAEHCLTEPNFNMNEL